MNKIKLYVLIIVIGFFGFIIGAFRIFNILQTNSFKPQQDSQQVQVSEKVINEFGQILVTIDFGNADMSDISKSIELNENATVFDILKLASDESSVELKTKQYDFGVFIESLGGLSNSKDRSWIYFVNGNSANVSADKYILKDGDVVEWKYITPLE